MTFLLKTYYEVEYQISTSVVNYIVIPFINKKVKSNRLGLLTLVIAHLEMKISLHFCLFLYCFTFDILPLVKFLSTYCRFIEKRTTSQVNQRAIYKIRGLYIIYSPPTAGYILYIAFEGYNI